MPWLTNPMMIDRAVVAAGATWGLTVAEWWREEPALWAWWRQQGWPETPKAGTGGIVAGRSADGREVRVWVYLSGKTTWALDGLGVSDGGPLWRVWNADDRPADLITPFNAHDRGGPPRTGAIAPGEWVGWITERRMNIGKAVTVTSTGNAASVEISPGVVVPREELSAKRVFAMRGRDIVMQWYWDRGETNFSHYRAFVAKMYHKWLKLTGTPKPAREGRHPRPTLMHPLGTGKPVAPPVDVLDVAVTVAKLKADWEAQMVIRDAVQRRVEAKPADEALNDAFYIEDEKVEKMGKAYAAAEEAWAKAVIDGDG